MQLHVVNHLLVCIKKDDLPREKARGLVLVIHLIPLETRGGGRILAPGLSSAFMSAHFTPI